MKKLRAAGVHFALSALIVGGFVVLTLLVWYPTPLDQALGVNKVLLVLLGVDVVIGPMLTFIVYKPGKRTLLLDLTVIAIAQFAAFGYGANAIFGSRPAYVVFNVDRFDVTSASEIAPAELAAVRDPAFKSIPFLGPVIVGARIPTAVEEKNRILLSAASGGPDLNAFPQYFHSYESMADDVRQVAKRVDMLPTKEQSAAVANWLATHAKQAEDVRWLPVAARRRDMTVIIDAKTAKVLGFVDASPWWGR